LSVIQRSRARQPLTRKRQTLMVWSGEAARPVALIFWAAGLVYHCASFCRCIAGENMALTSKLFAGNQALEAAATQDAAHIQIGARGPHVEKIQTALNLLDGAGLTVDGAYGPGTAKAVLAYKTKRNIINRSYQTSADNAPTCSGSRATIHRAGSEPSSAPADSFPSAAFASLALA
jgi:hypothetical protein